MLGIRRTIGIISGPRIYIRDRTLKDCELENKFIDDPELLKLDPPVNIVFQCTYFSIITIDGVHIGLLTAYNYTRDEVEIGARIWDRNYWDKGYGSEAIKIFCDWIFSLGVKKILARVVTTNIRALKCDEKCGFEIIGYQMMSGHNMVMMKKEKQQLLEG